MNLDTLLLYTVVSFVYIISPGPAIFLAMSNGLTKGMAAVATSSLGNVLGLFLLSAISILGLGALLAASSNLFLVVKIVGASYLIYLGIKQFRHAKKGTLLSSNDGKQGDRPLRAYFSEGFLVAATNPKPILFFTAFFPQFLNLEASMASQFFTMTGIFMLLSFLSLCSYGYISRSARQLFANQSRIAWFHRITGGLFIGMGIGMLQLRNSQ